MAELGLFFFALNKVLLSVVNGAQRMRAFAIFTSIRYLGILVALFAAMALEFPGERLAYVFSASEAFLFLALAVEIMADGLVKLFPVLAWAGPR